MSVLDKSNQSGPPLLYLEYRNVFHYSFLVSLLSEKQAQRVWPWCCCISSNLVHSCAWRKKSSSVFFCFFFNLDPFTSDLPCFVSCRESSVSRGRRGSGGRFRAGRPCRRRLGAHSLSPGAAPSQGSAARTPPSSSRFHRGRSSRRTS